MGRQELGKKNVLFSLPLASVSASITLGCHGRRDVIPAWLCGYDCTLSNKFLSSPILEAIVFSVGFQVSTVYKVKRLTKKEYIHQRREKCYLLRALSATHSSVQFSHSVMSDSSCPHESQHARPPCPSPTRVVYSNSCP